MRASRILFASFATIAISLAALPFSCSAEDAFYDIAMSDLKITAGELPKPGETQAYFFGFDRRWREAMEPWAEVDTSGEAYVDIGTDEWRFRWNDDFDFATARLLVRAPAGKDVTGELVLPKRDHSDTTLIKFSVPASAAKEIAKERFYFVKADSYARLEDRDIPGKAWFRQQFAQALDQFNKLADKEHQRRELTGSNLWNRRELADAYDLFSGGRAISESLQLNRALRERSEAGEAKVDISTLEGITIAQIDWKPLLKDANPKLDPLSKAIPADQHVLFFPSFEAAMKISDEANGRTASLFQLAEPQTEDNDVQHRYERQLGLSLSTVGRIIGPHLIKSIAVTGSDPYFLTGTDVAVLFESDQPDVLATALYAQVQLKSANQTDAKPASGQVEGVSYQGIRSPGREVCSYVAQVNGAVVVTNSLGQLKRLANVGKGTEAISTLDEYKFFRTRYPLGDAKETAFLFLSDATIRRWCSPQWRIATARRVFAAGALADLTAQNVAELGKGKVEPRDLHPDFALVDPGELKLTAGGVTSSTQGSLVWMTPIIERPIEKVTQAEADAYKQWRDNYQRNWRWAFDPIGLSIGVGKEKLAGDLTVMPLIAGTEYREFVALTRKAKIQATSGDPHGALVHLILALDVNSQPAQSAGNFFQMMTAGSIKANPLSWLGPSVSLYVDDDPVWEELRKMSREEKEKFYRGSWSRLPIGLHADVSSSLKLTVFLTGVRAFIEQTSPGMTTWEAKTYRDEPYVCVKPTSRARREFGENEIDVALYYAPSVDGLTVTLNEGVLKRAIDRRLDRAKVAENSKKSDGKQADGAQKATVAMPWLGSNVCLQVDRKMFEVLSGALPDAFDGASAAEAMMQERSWSNLPILNEWKRMFPDQDPVKVHERLWGVRLICPGGGKYVWNDEWKTMESTVYGHPGEPKKGPTAAAALQNFTGGNFGLTFEDQGLRARVELMHQAEKDAQKTPTNSDQSSKR